MYSRRHRTRLCKAAYEAHCNYQCLETLRITSTYRDLSLRAQTRRRAMRKRLKTAKGVSSIIGCGPPAAVASEAPRPRAVLHMHCPRTGSTQKRRTAADAKIIRHTSPASPRTSRPTTDETKITRQTPPTHHRAPPTGIENMAAFVILDAWEVQNRLNPEWSQRYSKC